MLVGVIFNFIFIIIIILNRNTAYLKLFKYSYLTIKFLEPEWALSQ